MENQDNNVTFAMILAEILDTKGLIEIPDYSTKKTHDIIYVDFKNQQLLTKTVNKIVDK